METPRKKKFNVALFDTEPWERDYFRAHLSPKNFVVASVRDMRVRDAGRAMSIL